MSCPVCDRRSRRSERRSGRCKCGYELATDDRRSVAIRARHDEELASRWITRGFTMLAVAPFLIFMALPIFGSVAALWYASPLIVAGLAATVTGLSRRHEAKRLLSRARLPLPLPVARTLE